MTTTFTSIMNATLKATKTSSIKDFLTMSVKKILINRFENEIENLPVGC